MQKVARIATCWYVFAMPVFGQGNSVAGAQVPSTDNASGNVQTYEVVSIKPSESRAKGGGWRNLPDGFQSRNMPLRGLVYSAYDIIMESQVSGMPSWAESDPYDIDAKVDAQTAVAWKGLPFKERQKHERLMLRALLADRCQFKAHEQTKELPIYDLVIAKGGLKMKEASANEESLYSMIGGNKGYKLTAQATTLDTIKNSLASTTGRMLVDKTGLGEKKFDFELEWTSDDQRAADTADTGPSIFTALEEQLGLKVISDRGQVEVLVIDHMERPSPN
jgi:uncharacterized protein (TIGR03435 family)